MRQSDLAGQLRVAKPAVLLAMRTIGRDASKIAEVRPESVGFDPVEQVA